MALENVTPKTRLEKYLAKIAGETVEELPNPKTRLEKYLARIAGADIVVPEPKTRLEYYLNILATSDSSDHSTDEM